MQHHHFTNLQKVKSVDEISDVAAQRLQRRVRSLGPSSWYLSDEQTVRKSFKIGRHYHKTFDGFEQVLKAAANETGQSAVKKHNTTELSS